MGKLGEREGRRKRERKREEDSWKRQVIGIGCERRTRERERNIERRT